LLIIDHVEELGAGGNLNLTQTLRDLKRFAVELDCPVLVSAQVSWAKVDNRKDKCPRLSDVPFADPADIVAFLYRPDYFEVETTRRGEVLVEIARNKFGSVCTVELLISDRSGAFADKG
jgi:replicative DNA helicase